MRDFNKEIKEILRVYIYVTVLKDSRGNENVPKDIKRPLGKLVKA